MTAADLRECSSCGDRVAYLSSRDLCDGCEAEAQHEALIDHWDAQGVSGYEL